MKTEEINKLKEALKEKGLDESFQTLISELNGESKDKRIENEQLENKIKAFEDKLDAIKSKLDVDNVDEIEVVVEETKNKSTEYEVLKARFDKLEEENKSEKEKIILAEKQNEINKMLTEKGVRKNLDHWQKSLVNITKRGEESNELYVDEKPLTEFIQDLVDNEDPIDSSRVDRYSQEGEEKLYSKEELENLSQEEIEKNMELVDKSYANL